MKPFNLEAAKRGEPIVTRDGRKATFIGHAPDADATYRLCAHIERMQSPALFYEDGAYLPLRTEHPADLFMAPRKRTVYINVYKRNDARWYADEGTARKMAHVDCKTLATAVPVEIEE